MYHFPRTIGFSVWSLQMEVIMHRGRCVFTKKKDRIWLPYPSTFPNTPRFLWGQGYVVALLKRDVAPSPLRQELRGAGSRVYSTQLTETSGATALGRRADCKVRRVAESQTLAVSWLRRLCTLSLCLSLRASISNCPWGTIITLLSSGVARILFLGGPGQKWEGTRLTNWSSPVRKSAAPNRELSGGWVEGLVIRHNI